MRSPATLSLLLASAFTLGGCLTLDFAVRMNSELASRGVAVDGRLESPEEAGKWVSAYIAAGGPVDPPEWAKPLAVEACRTVREVETGTDVGAGAEAFCDGLLGRE